MKTLFFSRELYRESISALSLGGVLLSMYASVSGSLPVMVCDSGRGELRIVWASVGEAGAATAGRFWDEGIRICVILGMGRERIEEGGEDCGGELERGVVAVCVGTGGVGVRADVAEKALSFPYRMQVNTFMITIT